MKIAPHLRGFIRQILRPFQADRLYFVSWTIRLYENHAASIVVSITSFNAGIMNANLVLLFKAKPISHMCTNNLECRL